MAIRSSSITAGKCYVTSSNEVRRVVEIKGMTIAYVLRGKMAFPSWDKQSWLYASKESFALQVIGEIPCECGQRAPYAANLRGAQARNIEG